MCELKLSYPSISHIVALSYYGCLYLWKDIKKNQRNDNKKNKPATSSVKLCGKHTTFGDAL